MTRALRNSLTFDVTFKVYDYTESYGEYINDNVYGVSHNNSIKEILDPTMKQYDARIISIQKSIKEQKNEFNTMPR